MARVNDGLRKRCKCSKRRWAKCPHPWWFGFSWQGKEYRFSLHKIMDLPLSYSMSRTEAESHRDQFKIQIRAGTFIDPTNPIAVDLDDDGPMTFGNLADLYLEQHVRVPGRRPLGRKIMEYNVRSLREIEIPVGGCQLPFEAKLLEDITKADIEAIRRIYRDHAPREKGGEVGCNRLLARLRHMFNWAIGEGYMDHTPFKRHGVTVIKLNSGAESPRTRRLEPGEEERLLEHASDYLQHIIIAALETGCRLGELLSMQWHQVKWQENVILLTHDKTKTNEARAIPMTRRLRDVLNERLNDPAGVPLGSDAHVFGNEVGERRKSFRTIWENCRKRAGVAGLHFHDLRREFASRLLESPGVALHDVSDWVGHSNVTTTSRYLSTTGFRRQITLERFELSRTPSP